MGKARAEIEITASSSKLASGLSAAARRFQDFSSSVARGTAATFKGMQEHLAKLKPGHTLSTAIGTFGGGMMTRVTDQMIEAGKGVLDFNRNLVRFQITGNMTKAETEQLGESIRQISKDTAISSDQVLAGGAAYVALTGDVKGSKDAMLAFARIAQATGSSTNDIATAAAALRTSLKIDPADFEKAFSVLAAQGKAGAVELKDFAGELAGIAPQFAQFKNMGGAGGLGELGAALQVVRNGFGSASEAATGLRSMMTELVKHSKEFEGAGVRIFDKDAKTGVKTMRNFSAIWGDINNSRLVKDPALLIKAFGRDEAKRAYDQLKEHKDLYAQLIDAGHEYGTIGADFDTYMQSSAGRIDSAWNKAKETMASVFTPDRMEALAEAVEAAASKLSDLFETLSDYKNFVEGNTAGQQNPYTAKAEDQKASIWSYMAALGGGQGAVEMDKQNQATVQNMVFSGAGQDPNAPDVLKRQESNRVAFDDQWESINKAGPRTKRARAAVEAAFGKEYGLGGAGPGAEGRERAGLRYIGANDIKSDEVNRIRDEMKASQEQGKTLVDALTAKITDAIKAGFAGSAPTVKIGDNQVAESNKKATSPRRAP